MILKVSKGDDYFYGFPTEKEMIKLESMLDVIFDEGYIFKKITQEEYEKEVEDYNNSELSEEIKEKLEEASFRLCDEFSLLIRF